MVKEFLSQKGVEYEERDVSIDRQAAQEMVNLTRQNGVPVTVIDGQAIIGFDQGRLEQALSQRPPSGSGGRASFGAAVADASKITQRQGGEVAFGAYVGKVHPGSAADRLRLVPGDIVVGVNGQQIAKASDLEKAVGQLGQGARIQVVFVRDGKRLAAEGVM